MWQEIETQIAQVTGQPFTIRDRHSVGGGCINQTYCLSEGDRRYFIKLNQAAQIAMFEAEAAGLEEIYQTQTIRVPRPICWGTAAGQSYLVLEWLHLGRGTATAWEAMGRQLAAMHHKVSQQGFGWHRNNTIGATPQLNPWTPDWAEFFAQQRIGYQLQLARRRGANFNHQEALLAAIPPLLAPHQPQPSLVHGDLWSGNAAFGSAGEPVLLDPAVYYGDREVDLAMTELFGGFPGSFYQGYQQAFPLAAGYEQRRILYNLYHILNHFNLFGGSYASQAQGMINQILAHARDLTDA